MIACLSLVALAKEPSAVFPPAPLTAEQAAELLVAGRIGPSARTYDQTTITPGFARAEELAIESALSLDGLRPAPDALRRYAREHLALRRMGDTNNRVEWFLAEHVGLATVPVSLVTFLTSDIGPETIRDLLGGALDRDPKMRTVAVAVERDDAQQAWVGEITALISAADFEPFPRTHDPGGVAVIPGTLLSGDARYALYVNQPGIAVRAFPLEGKGAFDVEIPLPEEPGAYRVTMNQERKRQLPDSAFFFTLYVGTDPPTSIPVVPPGPPRARGASEEQAFLAQINHARAEVGVGPLTWVDRTAELRASLAGMPGHERRVAQWRFVRQITEQDPLPGQAHGPWGSAFTNGQDAAEAAWTAIQHPITRDSFLDGGASQLVAGAVMAADGQSLDVLSFVVAPPSDPLASREAAFAALRDRYDPLGHAPKLQLRLDRLAVEVATGRRSPRQAMADVKDVLSELQKQGAVEGSMTWTVLTVPAGDIPDVSSFAPEQESPTIAIGAANGDLGSGEGFDYTVLILVAVGKAA